MRLWLSFTRKFNTHGSACSCLRKTIRPPVQKIITVIGMCSNLRECYFQAVSNSRWANKGYLVCAEINLNDTELLDELGRLANAYGIGVIKLDLINPDESKVLFEAYYNEAIEWGFINYLFELNADYKTFIEASIDILKTEVLYRERFDTVLSQQEIHAIVQDFRLT